MNYLFRMSVVVPLIFFGACSREASAQRTREGEGSRPKQREPLKMPSLEKSTLAQIAIKNKKILERLVGKTAQPKKVSEELLSSYSPGKDLLSPSFTPGVEVVTVVSSDNAADPSPLALNLIEEIDQATKAIFGTDDRGTPRVQEPYTRIGKLVSDTGWCTGALVGPRHILTAAHCFKRLENGLLSSATFVPFYQDGNGSFGDANVEYVYYGTIPPEVGTTEDWAVGILDRRIGDDLGWFGYRSISDSWFYSAQRGQGQDIILAGYSGDWYNGERMGVDWRAWFYWRMATDRSVVAHDGDMTAGASGGPLLARFQNLGWSIVGINIAGPKDDYWPEDAVYREQAANLCVDIGRLADSIRLARKEYP